MGGLISILTTAAYDELPIKSVAMVASPFDQQEPHGWPAAHVGKVTGGRSSGPV
jgi:polyhydroxyalkanoate synthase